ncbi:MAG: hypothetical protein ABL901_15690 [Hyphomicrobiaceae bacterium]
MPKKLTAFIAWIQSFAAWIQSKMPAAKAAAAPVLDDAQDGIAAFNDNVEASFVAVKGNRRGWLFTGLLMLTVALGGFLTGHTIAKRGVVALKDEIVALKAGNLALKKQAKIDVAALALNAEDLNAASAEIDRLQKLLPKPEPEPAAKPAKAKKPRAVKAGWP